MRQLFLMWSACMAFVMCTAGHAAPAVKGPSPRAWSYAVIGVEDMQAALELWQERFGMELANRARGGDPGLSRVWGLPADAIADQALLNTPGMLTGGVHLVQFAASSEAVRVDAVSADLLPAAIEIAVGDIDSRPAELEQAGYGPPSPLITLETKGLSVRELRMIVHDGVNLVLFEERRGKPLTMSPQGYAVAPQIVAATADIDADVTFFREVLGLELVSQHRFEGPQLANIPGLPAGVRLDVRTLGARDSRFGRVELAEYQGAEGRDLYWRSAPPARGLISITYVVPDLTPILARGRSAGMAQHGIVKSILGEGRMASVTSPAGLRIDLVQL